MSDDFDNIVAGMSFDIPDDIINVSEMSIEELVTTLDNLNEELFDMGEALDPKTQESRDKHSLRNAIQIELFRRSK
jgi:ribosomal protein L29